MLGNEEDFTACLGLEVKGLDEHILNLEVSAFKTMIQEAVAEFPNLKVIATTLRVARSATRNDWGAICWAGGKFYQAPNRADMEILDRVGGGDSFASGLIYGLMQFNDPQRKTEAQIEIQAIADYLASAVGLGGRDRRISSDTERARSAVTNVLGKPSKKLATQSHPSVTT